MNKYLAILIVLLVLGGGAFLLNSQPEAGKIEENIPVETGQEPSAPVVEDPASTTVSVPETPVQAPVPTPTPTPVPTSPCGKKPEPRTPPPDCHFTSELYCFEGKWKIDFACDEQKLTEDVAIVVEADDSGFYPAAEIKVSKGALVELTFQVRFDGVYSGGLDFRSDKWQTGPVLPGKMKAVEFVADQSFEFYSYWPTSDVRKAMGKIIVE